ncbi:hypothetical protein I5677_02755 [Mobilitalea sibirica]|uniref:Lipoprotein n=1 Tax=Mobilitalea sibirica TaxID=1462919 RepID=A0A8J7KZA8_9FIRM|nr:hypothetical protein [Mobilitalea sibirica]MBH1939813.1 hypothetical protein [Mobilitalea sibirica]
MNKMNYQLLKFLMLCMLFLLLTGCGKKEEKDDTAKNNTNVEEAADNNQKNEETDKETEAASDASVSDNEEQEVVGYPFEFGDVTIHMNTNAASVIEALGEPVEYFEAESCAFKGLDKIYYYNGFELSTYPMESEDFISSVNFLDDSVSTTEGIYLGSTLEEMLAAYGNDYTQEMGMYIYTLGETELNFLVEDGVITAITYLAIVEGLE